METTKKILSTIKETGIIDFRQILRMSKDKKQFREVLKNLGISNHDINRFISDAELYEPKLQRFH